MLLFTTTRAFAEPKIINAAGNPLRVIITRHYEIHTDLSPAFADDLGRRMDAMYDEYVRRLREFRPPVNSPRMPAYLFEHREDYMKVTLFQGANTGGMFVADGPGRTFLASYLEGQGRDGMRRILQHEAFHQFAYFAISKHLPIWLNEGLAQLFEEGIWTGHSFQLGQVPPRRVRQLHSDFKNLTLVPFKKFLAITPKEWSANLTANADRGATYYNQAWAMVQFLAMSGNPAYETHLVMFLRYLHNGMDPATAFRESLSDNIEGFQARFTEWAEALKATPAATLIERQDTLGDLLEAVSKHGQSFHSMAAFRAAVTSHGYRLHYTRGKVQWTTDRSPQVYFSDLQGRLYDSHHLFFQREPDDSLPDIVCRPDGQIALRTHFYKGVDRTEHEVLIQSEGH